MTRVRAYLRGRADDLMKWAEQQAAALNAAEKEKLIAWANAEAKTLRHKSTVASVEFDPQLTLMIAGNTQPSFRGVDEEIQSRVVMVPFSVTIPPKRRDTGLIDKLKRYRSCERNRPAPSDPDGGTEQDRNVNMITEVITPLTPLPENPSKREAPAGWRRGYAADCKSVKTGSIPVPASKFFNGLHSPRSVLEAAAERFTFPTSRALAA